VKSATISGSGVFPRREYRRAGAADLLRWRDPGFQVVIPDFGVVEGPFQITALEYAGSHNGEATYEVTLASAGLLTFTAL
jgi:TP901-1 family phage major tail protein